MLQLELRPSPLLATLLALGHGLGAALMWATPLGLAARFVISIILGASLLFHLRRDALRTASAAIVRVRFDPNCKCSYQLRDGPWQDATLLGSSMVTPWLSVLNFRPEGSRWRSRSAVLLPDAVDREDYRRLRVLLNWRCSGEDSDRQDGKWAGTRGNSPGPSSSGGAQLKLKE